MTERFASLARRDKEIRERRAALERERQEWQSQRQSWETRQKLAKEDPLRLLDEMGLSYEDLTNRYFDRLTAEESRKKPESRIENLERKVQEYEEYGRRMQQEAQQRQLEQQERQFRDQIKSSIDAEPDRFELVIAQNRQDDVFRLIEQHFQQQGGDPSKRKILSIVEAAQLVEDHLYEEAQKLLQAKKLKQRAEGKDDPAPKAQSKNDAERSTVAAKAESARERTNEPDPLTGVNRGSVLDLSQRTEEFAKRIVWPDSLKRG